MTPADVIGRHANDNYIIHISGNNALD